MLAVVANPRTELASAEHTAARTVRQSLHKHHQQTISGSRVTHRCCVSKTKTKKKSFSFSNYPPKTKITEAHSLAKYPVLDGRPLYSMVARTTIRTGAIMSRESEDSFSHAQYTVALSVINRTYWPSSSRPKTAGAATSANSYCALMCAKQSAPHGAGQSDHWYCT